MWIADFVAGKSNNWSRLASFFRMRAYAKTICDVCWCVRQDNLLNCVRQAQECSPPKPFEILGNLLDFVGTTYFIARLAAWVCCELDQPAVFLVRNGRLRIVGSMVSVDGCRRTRDIAVLQKGVRQVKSRRLEE